MHLLHAFVMAKFVGYDEAFVMGKFVGYDEAAEPFSAGLMQPCTRGGLGLKQWVKQTNRLPCDDGADRCCPVLQALYVDVTAAVAFQLELVPCSSLSAASSTTSIVKCCKPRLHSGLQPQFCRRAQEEDEMGMNGRGCLFGQVALHHQPTQA
jgi:hypothetical protein